MTNRTEVSFGKKSFLLMTTRCKGAKLNSNNRQKLAKVFSKFIFVFLIIKALFTLKFEFVYHNMVHVLDLQIINCFCNKFVFLRVYLTLTV